MTRNVYARGLIVLLSAVCFTSIASAQTSWWRTYGGPEYDAGYVVQQTTDGGYIIAGITNSFGAGTPDFDNFYLIRTDSAGDTLWTRAYGGPSHDCSSSAQQTTDGGYIITGMTYSFGAGNGDVYLVKTNASGDTLWTKTYGGVADDAGNFVRQTADSGYIIAGWTFSFGPGTPTCKNIYLIKTSAQGDTLWTRTYGGTDYDGSSSVQQTADGGYIVAGYTRSFGADSGDVYLVKTRAQGDTLWTRTYGGSRYDGAASVQLTSDGGYIIAGNTNSFGVGTPDSDNVYVIKTDSSGDTLWTRAYGGSSLDAGSEIHQTADGGYIVVGLTGTSGAGYMDVYLVKTNAAGDTLWTRTYGGTDEDWGLSVQQTADGGYIVAGFTYSYGAGSEDVYLIKTDAGGNVGIEEPLPRYPARPARFLVQPNPFTSLARVPGHETDVFVLSDVTGRQVAVCKGDRVGEGLRPGVYFLSPVGPRAGRAVTATIVKTAF